VKLRSLLQHLHAEQVPLLPTIEPTDAPVARGPAASHTAQKIAQEEMLERLLTPFELDQVRHHRV
jgi:hypothetical protein